ncbi:MAG TPA: hypothetical protein VJT67_04515 [Longimicrobiaceae bacterium]|nr:hypothetical protein [Longimicrobiaceae bacterium]
MPRFPVIALSLIGLASSHARAQEAAPFPTSAVPARGARAESFVPTGWRVAHDVSGDLNGDGWADHVIHLVDADSGYDPDAVTAAPESHALLILLADHGGWRRAGMSTKLLQTLAPQWGLTLTIRRGVLIVNQNYGMTEVTDITHRFRLDPAAGRFLLIGRDQLNYHRPQEMSDPVKVSENYLTGQRLITTGHYTAGGGYRETERRETIPRTKAYFDDIAEDDQG